MRLGPIWTPAYQSSGSPSHHAAPLRSAHGNRQEDGQGGELQVSHALAPLRLRDSADPASHSEIEHTMYVLNVDLWSEDALKEVNLVRHTTATPSISSTTPASYAAIEQSTPAYSNILPSNREVGYPTQMYQPPNPSVNPYAMQPQSYQGMWRDPWVAVLC